MTTVTKKNVSNASIIKMTKTRIDIERNVFQSNSEPRLNPMKPKVTATTISSKSIITDRKSPNGFKMILANIPTNMNPKISGKCIFFSILEPKTPRVKIKPRSKMSVRSIKVLPAYMSFGLVLSFSYQF